MEEQQLTPDQLFAERYLINRPIGKGGMGEVYLATDTILNDEVVALKVLRKKVTSSDKHTQRFLREVQLTRQVTHENIVRTFDVGVSNGLLFFTMEYVKGEPLSEVVRSGPLTWLEAGDIVLQLCAGLEAIHDKEIVHRDLKPGNVIITHDGIVKITDFGVARPTVSQLTTHDEVIGSSHYMAPEVWIGKDISFAADLYALGVLAYELVTGCVPFDADSPAELMWKHLEEAPVPPHNLAEDLPDWLNQLIVALLEKDHNKRPFIAGEIKNFVRRSLNGTAITGELRVLTPELDMMPSTNTTDLEIVADPLISQFDLESPLTDESLIGREEQNSDGVTARPASHDIDPHLIRVGSTPSDGIQIRSQKLELVQAAFSTAVIAFILFVPVQLGLDFAWKKALLYSNLYFVAAVLCASFACIACTATLPAFLIARTLREAAPALLLWKQAAGVLFALGIAVAALHMLTVGTSWTSFQRSSLKREVVVPLSAAGEVAAHVGLLSAGARQYTEVESGQGKALVKADQRKTTDSLLYVLALALYSGTVAFLFRSYLSTPSKRWSIRATAILICGSVVPAVAGATLFELVYDGVGSAQLWDVSVGQLSLQFSLASLIFSGCLWSIFFVSLLLSNRISIRDSAISRY